MQSLPQIFDGTSFHEPDQLKLSSDAIARLDAVRSAFNALKLAEQQVADAEQAVRDAEQQVAAAEEIVAPFGPYDFHRLWRQSVRGE